LQYTSQQPEQDKKACYIFCSNVVSKREYDETVKAKTVSRDEANCPGTLTDRTFEPGGENDTQELKVKKKSSSYNTESAAG
jgi:hypothetical protein